MKLNIDKQGFYDALNFVTHGTATRSTIGTVRLIASADQKIHMISTDADTTTTIDIQAEVAEPGVCVVPGRIMTDIVKSLPSNQIVLRFDEGMMDISSLRSSFTVRVLDVTPVAELPQLTERTYSIDLDSFSVALKQVLPSASSDESRPILTGVLLNSYDNKLTMVATDSYRLAIKEVYLADNLTDKYTIILPAKPLNELQRFITTNQSYSKYSQEIDSIVSVYIGDAFCQLVVGNVQLRTRFIEGKYPAYERLIPSEYTTKVVVGKDVFVQSLRRVRLLVRDDTTPMKMNIEENKMILTVTNQDIGSAVEEIDIEYSDDPIEIAFNPQFLQSGSEVLLGNSIEILISDTTKPSSLQSVDDTSFKYLLMPIKLVT